MHYLEEALGDFDLTDSQIIACLSIYDERGTDKMLQAASRYNDINSRVQHRKTGPKRYESKAAPEAKHNMAFWTVMK